MSMNRSDAAIQHDAGGTTEASRVLQESHLVPAVRSKPNAPFASIYLPLLLPPPAAGAALTQVPTTQPADPWRPLPSRGNSRKADLRCFWLSQRPRDAPRGRCCLPSCWDLTARPVRPPMAAAPPLTDGGGYGPLPPSYMYILDHGIAVPVRSSPVSLFGAPSGRVRVLDDDLPARCGRARLFPVCCASEELRRHPRWEHTVS
jgi:hypothetical protein